MSKCHVLFQMVLIAKFATMWVLEESLAQIHLYFAPGIPNSQTLLSYAIARRRGLVVERRTLEREVGGSILTQVLCP